MSKAIEFIAWFAISALAGIAVAAIVASTAFADATTYRMQVELNRKGCNAGEPDGIHGAATTAALRCFQRREGLRVTGKPTGRTLGLLFLRDEPGAEPEESVGAVIIDRRQLGQCGERVIANGEKKYGKGRATTDAVKVWKTDVAGRYGTQYVDWSKAQEGQIECRPACATCTVSYECEVSAIPCR